MGLVLTRAVAAPALCILLYERIPGQIYRQSIPSGCSSSLGTGTGQLQGGFTWILCMELDKRHLYPQHEAAPQLLSGLRDMTTNNAAADRHYADALVQYCFNNDRLVTGAVKLKQKCIEDIVLLKCL